MNTPEQAFDLKAPKKAFSRIGFALIALLLVTFIAQFVLVAVIVAASQILGQFYPDMAITSLSYSAVMLLSSVTQYLIGFPVFYLIIRSLKTEAPKKFPCKISTFIISFVIAAALMYMGQNIGNFVYIALYEWLGIDISAVALEVVDNISLCESFIYLVILAPIVEEIMFRKLIINRTRMYGEKLSLFFSALIFALFHMNPQQFFYSFFLGLLLGYLYLRRGKLLPCIILHAAVNFTSGVIPLFIYRIVDIDAMTEIMLEEDVEAMIKMVEENLLGYTFVSVYGLSLMALTLAGFIVYVIKTRKVTFKESSEQLPKDTEATVAFTNVGVALLILISIVFPIVSAYFTMKM